MIKVKHEKSDIVPITKSLKLGGILSPYLFNYFINDLIAECNSLNIGCNIGQANTSIIAYYDDLILLSPVQSHMNKLLKVCEKFQQDWNIKFNLKKSFSLNKKTETDVKTIEKIFILNNSRLNDVNQIIYLWLPIGQREFIRKFWENMMNKVIRSLYSLNGIGCAPNSMDPSTIAFIYRIYCHPIFCYEL